MGARFIIITALDPPDFRTISTFRKRHRKRLPGCRAGPEAVREGGLVKLGHWR